MNEQSNNHKHIENILSEAKAPLTEQQICKRLFKSENDSLLKQCTQCVQSLLEETKIFTYPSLRKNSKVRYWNMVPYQHVKKKIYRLFEKDLKIHTFKSVKGILSKWELEFFDEALGLLIRERKIFELKFGRTRYLKGINTLTTELLEWFNPFREKKLTRENLEAFLKGDKVQYVHEVQKRHHTTLEDDLFRKWYEEDRHKRYGLETIPIKWTAGRYLSWCEENSYEADIEAFNKRLKTLNREGKAELTHHSMPDQIPEGERKDLFTINHGSIAYYWRYIEES